MGLGGKKYFSSLFLSLSFVSAKTKLTFMELKIGDETEENIVENDDDDLESIQFARGEKFSKKKEKKRNAYTFRSLSLNEYPFREIFESNVEGIKVNSFTERERERTIESFLFHAFQDLEKRGGEKIERLNLSQRFHFGYRVARTEGNSATMLFLPIRLLACPPLFRRGENRRINERRIRRIGAILPPPTKHIFPRFSPRLSSQVPRFRSIFQASEAWPICDENCPILNPRESNSV